MGVLGLLWVILIALKIAGVGAMVSASWWLVILWPIPVYIFIILVYAFFSALS